jgi:hypothetical protein
MSHAGLGVILFTILGFCGFLALGAYLGKKVTPQKMIIFSGVLALVAVVGFSVFAAFYFLTKSQ